MERQAESAPKEGIKKGVFWSATPSLLPLTLQLKANYDFSEPFKLVIWNYNSMMNVDCGVKDLRIYASNAIEKKRLLFKGQLSKGSGNPVFNFSDTIFINTEENQPELNEIKVNRPASMQAIMKRRLESGRDRNINDLEKSWKMLDFFQVNESRRNKRVFEEETKHNNLQTSWLHYNSKKSPRKHHKRIELDFHLLELNEIQDSVCIVPELPHGSELVIDILSTWGDIHYVGLTGVEIFQKSGEEIGQLCRIEADPSDINVLPEYGNDPRVVQNLLNGINQTKDDIHMWLAPFVVNQHHLVRIQFPKRSTLALLRLWNYNKSRVHANRGAKDVVIYLDQKVIFYGEIQHAASLELENAEGVETILFTEDEEILELVAKNDILYRTQTVALPKTVEGILRPQTGVTNTLKPLDSETSVNVANSLMKEEVPVPSIFEDYVNMCRDETQELGELSIRILSNWFDQNEGWIAFDAIQFLDENNTPLPTEKASYLIDGKEFGESLQNMVAHNLQVNEAWFGAFQLSHVHEITFSFSRSNSKRMRYIKFWNCNTSNEDTGFGFKNVSISATFLNLHNQNFILRRSPFLTDFDYAQIVDLKQVKLASLNSDRLPVGFIVQINIYMAWGDHYYVGLDGLVIYDEKGEEIHIASTQVKAIPDSVNVLHNVANDSRTPDKLVDGIVHGAEHSWLAPIFSDRINKVYVVFNEPKAITGIQLFNYSKNPDRGVKDFGLILDGKIVTRACLPIFSKKGKGSILSFDKNAFKNTAFAEEDFIIPEEPAAEGKQDVRLINIEDERVERTKVDESLRPMTSLPARKLI
ncbi:hypothetical protein Ciccas_000760 [Cichlidogyrus casuarinus]|uniref:KATNIP domain-containing protein n=1 Tax=Cichlidogyrus casuarinus TaxID=1844966 RepID=A0ABD2QPY0_9PLAT